MKNNSRRLKHLKLDYTVFVRTDQSIKGLEHKITENLSDFVVLEKKYILKGHSKENDLKKVENKVESKTFNDGYLVALHIHIHHYTKFYFNINNFLYHLGNKLNLEPNNVLLMNQKQPEETEIKLAPIPEQTQPEPEPQPNIQTFI